MKYLAFALAFATIECAYGQDDLSTVDRKDLRTFVKILTSDSLEGRGTGSEGQKKAARFIAARFRELGLEQPSGQDDYFEHFTLDRTYWGQVYMKTETGTLENFRDMVLQGAFAENEEVEKEVVFGGWGEESTLSDIELRDRLVLVFVENLRSYHELNKRVARAGAYGLIIANPYGANQLESIKKTFKDYTLQKRFSLKDHDFEENVYLRQDGLRLVNTIIVPNSALKRIIGFNRAELLSKSGQEQIVEVPVAKVKIRFEKVVDAVETENVVGLLRGRTDRTIIISAHYDHLGKVGRDHYPGADDNASGVAALVELAEHFSRRTTLQYNLLFLATSAEESGLLGATFHVSKQGFDANRVLCNLNIDMISRTDDKHTDGNYIYCIGTDQFEPLHRIVGKADEMFDECHIDYSLNNSRDPTGIFPRADNYVFYRKGVPSVHFFSGLHTDYHQPTDTTDKIDFKNLERRARQLALVVELLQRDGLGY